MSRWLFQGHHAFSFSSSSSALTLCFISTTHSYFVVLNYFSPYCLPHTSYQFVTRPYWGSPQCVIFLFSLVHACRRCSRLLNMVTQTYLPESDLWIQAPSFWVDKSLSCNSHSTNLCLMFLSNFSYSPRWEKGATLSQESNSHTFWVWQ